MSSPQIAPAEYQDRRASLRDELDGAIGVVHAGDATRGLVPQYRPHSHFVYLTGISDEPGAILVLDPGNPVPEKREALFLAPLDRERERWDGYREEISSSLRTALGFKTILRTPALAGFLAQVLGRPGSTRLACLHPLAQFNAPISPDLALFQKIVQRMPGREIIDAGHVLPGMRAVKSEAEGMMLQQAVDITSHGIDAACAGLVPGIRESDLQVIIEQAYREQGGHCSHYGSIIGAGMNSTVLHYQANRAMIEDGDLVCIDSGASWGFYGADMTRTLPASGTFSERQREIYSIVLDAMQEAESVLREGVTFAELDTAARDHITKAGYEDAFPHGIGHHLGLETHDTAGDGPLKAGAVITIEPGIYLPQEKIGIRIEDNYVVTGSGYRNMSSAIPRTSEDIEERMAS